MPPVSEAQRKAMRAAEAGASTLGIPQSVGKEFSASDPGGKLPVTAKKRGHRRAVDYGDLVQHARKAGRL